MLDWVNVVGTPTRPTTPLKARLTTTTGTDSTAGTEVSGGSYVSQTVVFAAASGTTSTSNTGALTYTAMPACTVTALEIWDSAGTPVRLWCGALTASKTLNAGDTFSVGIGSLSLSLD